MGAAAPTHHFLVVVVEELSFSPHKRFKHCPHYFGYLSKILVKT